MVNQVQIQDTFLTFMNKTNDAISVVDSQISPEQLAKLNTTEKLNLVKAINEVLRGTFKTSGGTVEGNLTSTGYLSSNTYIRIGSNNNGDSVIYLYDDSRNLYKALKWNVDKDALTIEDNNGSHNIILHENMTIACDLLNLDLTLKNISSVINSTSTYKSGEMIYLKDTKHIAYHDGVTRGGYIIPNMQDIADVGKTLISPSDNSSAYLIDKIKGGDGIYINKIGGGSNESLSIQSAVKAGLINFWPGQYTTIPLGWCVCDGRTLNRTNYADLFRVLGTTYGSGNGSTTFNIPNLAGRFLLGTDQSITYPGAVGGEKSHTLTTAEMPSHTHTVYGSGNSGGDRNRAATYTCANARAFNTCINHFAARSNREAPVWATERNYAAPNVVAAAGSGSAHNNMPPYSTGFWIIFTNVFVSIDNKPIWMNSGQYFLPNIQPVINVVG